MNFINTKTEALKKLYKNLTGEESPHYTETKVIDDIAEAIENGGGGGGGGLPEVTSDDIGKILSVGEVKGDTALMPETSLAPTGSQSALLFDTVPEWFSVGEKVYVDIDGETYPTTITTNQQDIIILSVVDGETHLFDAWIDDAQVMYQFMDTEDYKTVAIYDTKASPEFDSLLPSVNESDRGKILGVGYVKGDTALMPETILSDTGSQYRTLIDSEKPDWFALGETLVVSINGEDYFAPVVEDDGSYVVEINMTGESYFYLLSNGGPLLYLLHTQSELDQHIAIYDQKISITADKYMGYDAVVFAVRNPQSQQYEFKVVKGNWKAVADKLDQCKLHPSADYVPSVLIVIFDGSTGNFIAQEAQIWYYLSDVSVPWFNLSINFYANYTTEPVFTIHWDATDDITKLS